MAHKSVLAPWLGAVAKADKNHNVARSTLLQRWLIPVQPVIVKLREQPHAHIQELSLNHTEPEKTVLITFPTTNCSDGEPDLFSDMPASIGVSHDSSINSDDDIELQALDATAATAAAPSDGYLWNLVPRKTNQYLDLMTMQSVSSSSRSRDSSQSDDSIVCDDDAITDQDFEQLQLFFPITTRRFKRMKHNHKQ
jgi:hypothetical protein